MKLYLIRHALTLGNEARCYIGSTDQPLSQAGVDACRAAQPPAVRRVYASPMRRCVQTAALLYPEGEPILSEGLREYGFGDFEGKTYAALAALPEYQAWIDSAGRMTPPRGEDWELFRRRCARAFIELTDDCIQSGFSAAAVVLHGGSMMAVLERFGRPARGFYDWQAEPLSGWEIELKPSVWTASRLIQAVERLGKGE